MYDSYKIYRLITTALVLRLFPWSWLVMATIHYLLQILVYSMIVLKPIIIKRCLLYQNKTVFKRDAEYTLYMDIH